MTLEIPNTIKIKTFPNPAIIDIYTTRNYGNYTDITNDQFDVSHIGGCYSFDLTSIEKHEPTEFQTNLSEVSGIREIAFFPWKISFELFEAFTPFQKEIVDEVIRIMESDPLFTDANIFKNEEGEFTYDDDDDDDKDEEGEFTYDDFTDDAEGSIWRRRLTGKGSRNMEF